MDRAQPSQGPHRQEGRRPDDTAVMKAKSAEELRSALRRSHVRFFVLAIACVAALFVCDPRLADQPRLRALTDLGQLSGEIDLGKLRSGIAEKAERDLAFDLERVVQAVAVPELTARQGAGPQTQLMKASPPAFASMGELAQTARSGAEVAVHGPSVDALAASLRWRLSRLREPQPVVLTGLRLSHAVDRQTVNTEASVEPVRLEALLALQAYEQAREAYTAKSDQIDALEKSGASKEALLPLRSERRAAYELLTENKHNMQRQTRAYQNLARRAQRRHTPAPEGAEGGRLVVATLEREGAKPWEIEVPMALPARFAATPPFAIPASLARLQGNLLWPDLKSKNVSSATAELNQQLSFHLRAIEFRGLRISGITVLQLTPLVLLAIMWMLIRACQAVLRLYSPLRSNQGAPLSTPGTGARDLDRALLITLPATVCGLACWALLRLDAQPWLALLLSAVLFAHSLVAARLWKRIHCLIDRSRERSLLQPLPERYRVVATTNQGAAR